MLNKDKSYKKYIDMINKNNWKKKIYIDDNQKKPLTMLGVKLFRITNGGSYIEDRFKTIITSLFKIGDFPSKIKLESPEKTPLWEPCSFKATDNNNHEFYLPTTSYPTSSENYKEYYYIKEKWQNTITTYNTFNEEIPIASFRYLYDESANQMIEFIFHDYGHFHEIKYQYHNTTYKITFPKQEDKIITNLSQLKDYNIDKLIKSQANTLTLDEFLTSIFENISPTLAIITATKQLKEQELEIAKLRIENNKLTEYHFELTEKNITAKIEMEHNQINENYELHQEKTYEDCPENLKIEVTNFKKLIKMLTK